METRMRILKVVIVIVLLLNAVVVSAQFRFGEKEGFVASIYVDPGASIKENGLDIGADLEYQGAMYAKVGIESFGKLPGNYFDIHAAFGPRATIGREERISIYTGVRAGVVFRYQQPNPILGFEFGTDYTFYNGLMLGINASTIRRGDIEKLYNEADFWRGNFYLKVGYKWDWKN